MELEEVVAVVSVTIVGELVIWLGIVIKATVVVVVLGLGDTAEAVEGVDIMVAVAVAEEGVIIVEKKDILRGIALTLKILLHVACPDWLIGHIEFLFFLFLVGFVIFFCWVLGDCCWEWNGMQSALAFVTKLFLVVGFLLGKLVFILFFSFSPKFHKYYIYGQ